MLTNNISRYHESCGTAVLSEWSKFRSWIPIVDLSNNRSHRFERSVELVFQYSIAGSPLILESDGIQTQSWKVMEKSWNTISVMEKSCNLKDYKLHIFIQLYIIQIKTFKINDFYATHAMSPNLMYIFQNLATWTLFHVGTLHRQSLGDIFYSKILAARLQKVWI